MAIFLIDRLNPFDNPLRLSSQRQLPVTIFRLCIVILSTNIDNIILRFIKPCPVCHHPFNRAAIDLICLMLHELIEHAFYRKILFLQMFILHRYISFHFNFTSPRICAYPLISHTEPSPIHTARFLKQHLVWNI